jgi:prepilin peptidase CpaA
MAFLQTQGVFWLVAVVLVVAAIIDGRSLKVPNWLTFPFAAGGVLFSFWPGGLSTVDSLAGLALGLALLLPLYAVGGMGAGDVKLLAGVGAWVGPAITLWSFVATVLVGAAMAIFMMARSGKFFSHVVQIREIAAEWWAVRDPVALAQTAAVRKPRMLLLPYGIPMAIGTIIYFLEAGLLF